MKDLAIGLNMTMAGVVHSNEAMEGLSILEGIRINQNRSLNNPIVVDIMVMIHITMVILVTVQSDLFL